MTGDLVRASEHGIRIPRFYLAQPPLRYGAVFDLPAPIPGSVPEPAQKYATPVTSSGQPALLSPECSFSASSFIDVASIIRWFPP